MTHFAASRRSFAISFLLLALAASSAAAQEQPEVLEAPPPGQVFLTPAQQPNTAATTAVQSAPPPVTNDDGEVGVATSGIPLGTSRTLNGHTFIRPLIVQFPFVATRFGSATGFGSISTDVVQQDENGNVGKLALSVAGVSEEFDMALAIADLVALELNLSGFVTVGTDNQSALYAGSIFSGTIAGGAAVQLLRTEQVAVAARLTGNYTATNSLSPIGFANALLENGGQFNTDALLVSAHQFGAQPSVAAAWAPAKAVGIQASIGVALGSSKTEDVDSEFISVFNGGLALTLDGVSAGIPVGFVAAYALGAGLSSGLGTTHSVETGIYYTELMYLKLGFAFGAQFGDEDILQGQLRLAHYW